VSHLERTSLFSYDQVPLAAPGLPERQGLGAWPPPMTGPAGSRIAYLPRGWRRSRAPVCTLPPARAFVQCIWLHLQMLVQMCYQVQVASGTTVGWWPISYVLPWPVISSASS